MSLGCGDNAAALAEVTASAAAQKIDFIVNDAMFVERPLSIARPIYSTYILLTRIIYLNGRRLHLVRGCGEMSSAKVLKVLAISHLLQQNLIFVLGSMQPEFKLTLPRSESILDYCAMQPLAWFLHKFIGAWMLSAERSHLVLTFSCHHVQRCRRTCGESVDCSLQQDITKSLPKSLGRPRFYTRYRVCHFQWQ
jgi:hypothetical protein